MALNVHYPRGCKTESHNSRSSTFIMAEHETSAENKAKILLDEANITFCETSERKDSAENRTLDGSPWDMGRMDGEFDEEDFQKILEIQLQAAQICDEHPELEVAIAACP